jgi:hypothetical protein
MEWTVANILSKHIYNYYKTNDLIEKDKINSYLSKYNKYEKEKIFNNSCIDALYIYLDFKNSGKFGEWCNNIRKQVVL